MNSKTLLQILYATFRIFLVEGDTPQAEKAPPNPKTPPRQTLPPAPPPAPPLPPPLESVPAIPETYKGLFPFVLDDGSDIIVFGAGHGVNTNGKRSPGGVVIEALVNRIVLYYATEFCKIMGISFIVIDSEAWDMSLRSRVAYYKWIKKQFEGRKTRYWSLHHNAAGDADQFDEGARGLEMVYHSNTPMAVRAEHKFVGDFIIEYLREFYPDIQRRKWDKHGDDYDKLYIPRMLPEDGVIFELQFMTSRKDVEIILDADYGRRMGNAIALAAQKVTKNETV